MFGTSGTTPFNLGGITATNTGFGAVTTSASPFAFGSLGLPPATAPVGSSFNFAPSSTPAVSSTPGFSFGAPNTAMSGGLTSGLLAASTTPSCLAFGATAPAVASTGTFSGGLGGTGISFGTPASSAAGISGFTFQTPTSSSVSFALPLASTSAPASGFPFGSTLTSTTTSAVTTQPFTGFGTTSISAGVTNATSALNIGLGGALPPSASVDASSNGSKSDGKSVKDTLIQGDFLATVSAFESHRAAEMTASEGNVRHSSAAYQRLAITARGIHQMLTELTSSCYQLQGNIAKMKADVHKEAETVEMCRRTKEMPMACQGQNREPEEYFLQMVAGYEHDMWACRLQIEEVAKCFEVAKNMGDPEDIQEVLRREHDTLRLLAGRVYSLHSQLTEVARRASVTPKQGGLGLGVRHEGGKSKAREISESAIIRNALGMSGLQSFQEGHQRAMAVTLGTGTGGAPPTVSLGQTPSIFGSGSTPGMFNSTGTSFLGGNVASSSTGLGTSSLFATGNTSYSAPLGSSTILGLPFSSSSPLSLKQLEDDKDSRRKRRI